MSNVYLFMRLLVQNCPLTILTISGVSPESTHVTLLTFMEVNSLLLILWCNIRLNVGKIINSFLYVSLIFWQIINSDTFAPSFIKCLDYEVICKSKELRLDVSHICLSWECDRMTLIQTSSVPVSPCISINKQRGNCLISYLSVGYIRHQLVDEELVLTCAAQAVPGVSRRGISNTDGENDHDFK